ncbi:MAG TPA: DUF2334 domain-containing protein [Verrucomicrobiae bacterium]|nr:DUF2334 domain-containing protein [Verrucomicrobiae bacterium]
MHYVILRDDDTNALTPVDCLERLYRPFLTRGLPVNLAVIPDVRLDAARADGSPEQFLFARNGSTDLTMPIGDNEKLVRYLHANPDFHIAQHGYDHSHFEFDSANADDIRDRLEQGTRLLADAGFARPQAFVAPYDKFSAASLRETAKRFRVISTGWFELERLPVCWWPNYALCKLARAPHWRIGQTLLLTHPGCLLSHQRPRATILDTVKQSVASRRLTVLVTHWWEYFPGGQPDEAFIGILHETARWLADQPDVKVTSFDDVASGGRAVT